MKPLYVFKDSIIHKDAVNCCDKGELAVVYDANDVHNAMMKLRIQNGEPMIHYGNIGDLNGKT